MLHIFIRQLTKRVVPVHV